jgi:DNA-binding transcriptional LysR family regulator
VADDTDLNWDDLRYFLLAARAGTLAGAARSSGVQHTTIGRRLSALERSFGAPLLLRSPDGLSLTPLGELFLPLEGLIDVEAERARVTKEFSKAEAELAKVRAKLADENFTGKVPPKVLDEHRQREADWAAQVEKLQTMLEALG